MVIRIAVVLVLVACTPLRGLAQTGAGSQPSPFTGSVPTGAATATPLTLTLRDAIDRGLDTNLGLFESAQDMRGARAQWLTNLSNLLPNVTAQVSSTTEQLSLASLGFSSIPGLPLPSVIGPFSYVDVRVSVSQRVFNWADISNLRSASASRQASEHSYKAAREIVVQATATAYLMALADVALVDATRAQVETGTVLQQNVTDQNRAGVVASIDVLRARVALQTEQQRLIAATNRLAIDKLTLARVIGLPNGQGFTLGDDVPYRELDALTLDETLARARDSRPDYRSAQAQVRAAQLAKQAEAAERYPSVSVDVNYGAIGTTFKQSNGTVAFVGAVSIPVFQGTSVTARVLAADAELRRTQAELEDLAGRIDYEVRTAFLNLTSANDLVTVTRSNVTLAKETLDQARDRLAAGVADNLEVVQAQESVATANRTYIDSVYAHNSAKVSLAQAIGAAEQSALVYLGVK